MNSCRSICSNGTSMAAICNKLTTGFNGKVIHDFQLGIRILSGSTGPDNVRIFRLEFCIIIHSHSCTATRKCSRDDRSRIHLIKCSAKLVDILCVDDCIIAVCRDPGPADTDIQGFGSREFVSRVHKHSTFAGTDVVQSRNDIRLIFSREFALGNRNGFPVDLGFAAVKIDRDNLGGGAGHAIRGNDEAVVLAALNADHSILLIGSNSSNRLIQGSKGTFTVEIDLTIDGDDILPGRVDFFSHKDVFVHTHCN